MKRESRDRGGASPHRRHHHHLEDEIDRKLDRYFGAGQARRRDLRRRQDQYARLAERLFELALSWELHDSAFDDLVVVRVELHPVSSVATVWVAVRGELEAHDTPPLQCKLDTLQSTLRATLARHLPRKRIPDVRIRVLGGER